MLKRLFLILLIIGSLFTLTSCLSEDLAYDNENSGEKHEYRGSLCFDLSMQDLALRTRGVSTDEGAPILIGNLWIGVFDVSDGSCIGSQKYENFNHTLLSGAIMKNILKVDFISSGDSRGLAYVAAVANYDDVTTWDGRSVGDLLPDFDHRKEITWDKLIELDIDTESAYAGNKGSEENSNAPLLAGFFQDAVSLTQNPKIDQFAYDAEGPQAIYPTSAAQGIDINLGEAANGKTYVAAGAICLRRLVSHNTVQIHLSNGYELTAAKYRRYNMPRAVYMFQRRTDINQYSDFKQWQKFSPNFADHLIAESDYGKGSETFSYADDPDWLPIVVNSWGDRENVSFAFEHFENKHWGKGNLATQEDREAKNPDGTFAALCNGVEDAYKSFASYFVLSLHVINKMTGESADIEYTLHEGFCNDEDGKRVQNLKDKCYDFSSFRNVNYTYNVNIAGINDITSYVTSEDSQGGAHPSGQEGKVWKMNFATGSQKSPIPIGGGTYDFQGKYMSFSSNPDLGFRIYGRDAGGNLVDVCYNMPDGMFEGFQGIWPGGNPALVAKTDIRTLRRRVTLGSSEIPQSLLDGMQIGNASGHYSIIDFIEGVEKGKIRADGQFEVKFADYDGNRFGLKGNYMRGLYIFDRNDRRNMMDSDGCSGYNFAYGAIQYPFELERIDFNPNNIYWDNAYYKDVTTLKNLFVATTAIFYGAESSVIDLRWKHDERFLGYRISVYNASYTHPIIIIPPDRLGQYLEDVKGQKVFVYPLNTADFPKSSSNSSANYNFSVTPIVDEDMYLPGEPTHIVYNSRGDKATCIKVCSPIWDLSTTEDWKNVLLKNLSDAEIHYRGLNVKSAVEIKDYGVKGSLICFGGGGNTTRRNFYFTASTPGKIAVSCRSHSGSADPARKLQIARMSPNGSLTNDNGERYDIVYDSQTMAGSQTTYTSEILTLEGSKPTKFVIFTLGSVDFYKFQFIPSK